MKYMFKRKSIKPKLSIRDIHNLRFRYIHNLRFRYGSCMFRYYAERDFLEEKLICWDWTYRTMIDAATEIDNRPKNVYYNYDKRRN